MRSRRAAGAKVTLRGIRTLQSRQSGSERIRASLTAALTNQFRNFSEFRSGNTLSVRNLPLGLRKHRGLVL